MAMPKLVKSALDAQIAALMATTDKRILVTWACDCAERGLPYFEKKRPEDQRPRRAIESGCIWVRDGVFKMADIHCASLTAGHAVATTHVPAHSIATATYAATAVRDSVPVAEAETAVTSERQWQYQRLIGLRSQSR
jgi:hypothetical protein